MLLPLRVAVDVVVYCACGFTLLTPGSVYPSSHSNVHIHLTNMRPSVTIQAGRKDLSRSYFIEESLI